MTIFKKKISNSHLDQLVNCITCTIRPSDGLIRIDEKIEGNTEIVTIKNSTNGMFIRIEKKFKENGCKLFMCEDNPKTAENITKPFQKRLTLDFNTVTNSYRYADQCMRFLLEGAVKDKVQNTRINATYNRKEELDNNTVFCGVINDFNINYKGELCSAILHLEDGTTILLDGEKTNKISIIKKGGMYVENKEGDFLIMSLAKFEKRFVTEETVAA